MVELDADEKEMLAQFIEKHIEQVEKQKQQPDQQPGMLGAELKYEQMLRNVLKKLR